MTDGGISTTRHPRAIPTPRTISFPPGAPRLFRRDTVYHVRVAGAPQPTLAHAVRLLRAELARRFGLHIDVADTGTATTTDVVLVVSPALLDAATRRDLDLEVLVHPLGKEQGYVLCADGDGPILVCAQSAVGCLYGVATLVQLFGKRPEGAELPRVRVSDRPDFRWRGNRWLLQVESFSWSYDWGDGIGAFRARTLEKLDMAAQAKVNLILFDGWGWGLETFPEYARLMRELNREARARGIHLMHGGYGTGQPAFYRDARHRHRGTVFENRRPYPDGPIYDCIAGPRYCGTCLSNDELMAARCAELERFVRATEPGALYIHQQDEGITAEVWKTRCPECRRRWPNEAVDTPDGMAGAYAYLYNRLVSAVKGVRTGAYDAERDCLIMLVSPGYLSYGLDDAEWRNGLRYWETLSGLLEQRDNVFPGFRELFQNRDGDECRVPQLVAALARHGGTQSGGIIYFYGADSHHNDKLFLPTPALNAVLLGLDMLVTSCANSFSEPLQLLNAEFMWNATGSAFDPVPVKPSTYAEHTTLYFQAQYGTWRPDELYGPDGFLHEACVRLYGEVAGPFLYRLFLCEGRNHEPPIPYLANSGLLRGEMRGAETGSGKREGAVFQVYAVAGPEAAAASGEARDERATKRALVKERVSESRAATIAARRVLRECLAQEGLEEGVRRYVEWYADCLREGVRYTRYLSRYMGIVEQAEGLAGDTARTSACRARVRRLRDVLAARRRHFAATRLKAVDYHDGALAGRETIVDLLEANLARLAVALVGPATEGRATPTP